MSTLSAKWIVPCIWKQKGEFVDSSVFRRKKGNQGLMQFTEESHKGNKQFLDSFNSQEKKASKEKLDLHHL